MARNKPKLLSGGNPQIPKGDGDAPVQAYIAAMPGWKRGVGRQLDALITHAVPNVRKAVRWNSPFYGVEGQGWFLSFHCFTKYIKVTFHNGASLTPLPPVESKHPDVRYFHIREGEPMDEALVIGWIKQASKLPGEDLFEQNVETRAPTVKAHVRGSIEVERAGSNVDSKERRELSPPKELEEKLAEAPAFKAAFDALTPGRQRGYILHFTNAKQAKTRASRIEKCTKKIFEGKGLNER